MSEQMFHDVGDLLAHIEDDLRGAQAMIKVTVLQITEHHFTLGMVSDSRYWMSGEYGSLGRAKGALTRLMNRSGGKNYQRVTFDEYQVAVRAIGE
jgi:hypothetical protein